MTHIENKNKFDFDCNVGEYICQDSSVGEAISSSLNLDKNCTVYVNEVVCNERLNLGGDDADYVLKIPRSLGCKVVFDDVPIHVRLEANKLEEKIDCLHHPDSIHLAHCISKNATMISNDKNLIKACNELSVPAFYLEDLLSGFYSLEKLRNLSKYFPITERTIISTENKIWGANAA
jgi:predicted nucleic acid-binding protein